MEPVIEAVNPEIPIKVDPELVLIPIPTKVDPELVLN